MFELFLDDDEINLILNLLLSIGTVPEGLDPTFYHTLSYEGDCKLKDIADGLKDKLTI